MAVELEHLSAEERKAFERYGRLPKQSQLLAKKDKKYFDSADWAKGQNSGIQVKHPGAAGDAPTSVGVKKGD